MDEGDDEEEEVTFRLVVTDQEMSRPSFRREELSTGTGQVGGARKSVCCRFSPELSGFPSKLRFANEEEEEEEEVCGEAPKVRGGGGGASYA